MFDGYGLHLEWPRNVVTRRTALLKTLASVLALSFSVGGGNVLAASDWNVRVVKVETGRSVPAPGGKGLWIGDETMSDVFYVGELIEVFCRYEYTKIAKPNTYPAFAVEFWGHAEVFATQPVAQTDAPKSAAWTSWIVKDAGTYNVGCRLLSGDANDDDNSGKHQITVLPKKPGEDGVLPAPAPEFITPTPGQKFTLGPSLTVQLKARASAKPYGNLPNFFEYAQATSTVERWHMEIVRIGTGNLKGFETKVGQVEGVLGTPEFGVTLGGKATPQWFEKYGGGAGNYAARVWFTQQRQSGVYVGPASRVEFSIIGAQSVAGSKAPDAMQASPPAGAWQQQGALSAPRVTSREVQPPLQRPNPTAARPSAPSSLPPLAPPPVAQALASARAPASSEPSWGELGKRAGSPPPQPAARSSTDPSATSPLVARVETGVVDPATERALTAAACTRTARTSGSRFTCANRAGFDRCEALRRQNKVEQCTLSERP